jgi:hypothetical protein
MHQFAPVQTLILKATAFALKGVLQRQIDIACFAAEEKFKALLKRSPHKYLASYVGMDAATICKMMNSVPIA